MYFFSTSKVSKNIYKLEKIFGSWLLLGFGIFF